MEAVPAPPPPAEGGKPAPKPSRESETKSPAKNPRRSRRTKPAVPSGEKRLCQSETARELRKCYVYKKAVGVYSGIRESSKLTQSVAKKVEGTSQAFCKSVIETPTGKKADRLLAPVARKANLVTRKATKYSKRVGTRLFHAAVRYWPATLFCRWATNATLGVSAVTLALMKDVAEMVEERPAKVKVVVVEETPESKTSETKRDSVAEGTDGTPVKPSDNASQQHAASEVGEREREASAAAGGSEETQADEGDEASQELDESEVVQEEEGEASVVVAPTAAVAVATQDEKTFKQWLEAFMEEHTVVGGAMRYCLDTVGWMLRFFLMLCMPLMLIWTRVVITVSNAFHKLTGLSELETAEERKERVDMANRLLETKTDLDQGQELEPLRPDQWLFDVVTDVQVGYLLKWPYIGAFVSTFTGEQRPIRLIEPVVDLADKLVRTEQEVVKYLQEDPKYDDKKDPDYQPGEDEASEDSLEYAEDEDLDQELRQQTDSGPLAMESPAITSLEGIRRTSTPKRTSRTPEHQGSPNHVTSGHGPDPILAGDKNATTILLPPLSPEKLKQIKTRDPIQAAVRRMKSDRIFEHNKKMEQAKQIQQFKQMQEAIQAKGRRSRMKYRKMKTRNDYEAIYEMPNEPEIEEFSVGVRSPKESFDKSSENIYQQRDGTEGIGITDGDVENEEDFSRGFRRENVQANKDVMTDGKEVGVWADGNDVHRPNTSVDTKADNIEIVAAPDDEKMKNNGLTTFRPILDSSESNNPATKSEFSNDLGRNESTVAKDIVNTPACADVVVLKENASFPVINQDVPNDSPVSAINIAAATNKTERTEMSNKTTEVATIPAPIDAPHHTDAERKDTDPIDFDDEFFEVTAPDAMPKTSNESDTETWSDLIEVTEDIPASHVDGTNGSSESTGTSMMPGISVFTDTTKQSEITATKEKPEINFSKDIPEGTNGVAVGDVKTAGETSQTSPKVRDFCGNPGAECRNAVEPDNGGHSSSVDTGQTTY